MEWFGDPYQPALYHGAIRQLESLGGTRIEVDFTPFRDAARLLYEGPWVAERWSAVRGDLQTQQNADALYPVTRHRSFSPAGRWRPAAGRGCLRIPLQIGGVAPNRRWHLGIHRHARPAHRPLDLHPRPGRGRAGSGINSQLGHLHEFRQPARHLAALAVPAGFRPDGLPFGITLFGPAWSDARLAALGEAFTTADTRTLGATGITAPAVSPQSAAPAQLHPNFARRGRRPLARTTPQSPTDKPQAGFVRATHTADCYQLFALAGTKPPKPGLRRVRRPIRAHRN